MSDPSVRLGATGGTQGVAAAGPTAAMPLAQQARGNQNVDQAASRPPVVPSVISLKDLAHASTDVSLPQSLVDESRELHHLLDFSDRLREADVSARALCWLCNAVSENLPGLAKFIADRSDFAKSLFGYLSGDSIFSGERLQKFEQLSDKLQGLDGLIQQADDKNAIANASAEINRLILELGPQGEITETPRQDLLRDMDLHLRGKKIVDGEEVSRGRTFQHYGIDWNTAITEDIFSQATPAFPKGCCFERDFFRGPSTLTIGTATLEPPEGRADEDTYKQKTREFVLDQITQLAEANGLDRVDVLRNFLRTYVGQDVSIDFRNVFRGSSDDALRRYDIGMTDHIPVTLEIRDDGSCIVLHDLNYQKVRYKRDSEQLESNFEVPCDIHMTMAYTSSLSDFTSGLPPHAIEDQCTISGRYLDMGVTV